MHTKSMRSITKGDYKEITKQKLTSLLRSRKKKTLQGQSFNTSTKSICRGCAYLTQLGEKFNEYIFLFKDFFGAVGGFISYVGQLKSGQETERERE